jgi:hypothetical protein
MNFLMEVGWRCNFFLFWLPYAVLAGSSSGRRESEGSTAGGGARVVRLVLDEHTP